MDDFTKKGGWLVSEHFTLGKKISKPCDIAGFLLVFSQNHHFSNIWFWYSFDHFFPSATVILEALTLLSLDIESYLVSLASLDSSTLNLKSKSLNVVNVKNLSALKEPR